MRHFFVILTLFTASGLWCQAGSSIVADTIQQEYYDVIKRWQQQLEVASSAEQRLAVLQLRPNTLSYCNRIKAEIRGEAQHAWTVKHQSFLLENDPRITEDDELALIEWANRNHIKSAGIGRFCMALVTSRPSQGIAHHKKVLLAEKVGFLHPDKSEQGLGALAQCMLLDSLGEGKEVLAKRMELVKKAIIHSSKMDLGGVSALKFAEAEVFKITKLSRGRVAPDIEGVDGSGVPFKLSDYRGNITMLIFWNSRDKEIEDVLEFCRKVTAKRINEPFVLLGVNGDPTQTLGSLKVDRTVTWRNFSDPKQQIVAQYYMANTPVCLILDKEGKVAYMGVPGAFADLAVDALRGAN